jgi:DNA-binding CsgD family transcriptional regulator
MIPPDQGWSGGISLQSCITLIKMGTNEFANLIQGGEFLNRLEQLEPEITSTSQSDVQIYALKYVEQYQRDVPQLERKRGLLLKALNQAWQREQYAQVVHLIDGLSHLAGRFDDCEEGERILRWGIEASKRIQDKQHVAYFLNRLGGLLWSRCEWANARQVWEESLEIAQAFGHPACLWEPLSGFAHMADILDGYEAARGFAETILCDKKVTDPGCIAAAHFIRGFYARLCGDRDRAYDDYISCLQPLSFQDPGASFYEHFFALEVQTELARLQGDYAHAQAYSEAALSLAHTFCDHYTVAVLLWDQALFALRQGMLDDVRPLALRLLDAKIKGGAPHFYQCGKWLLQQLPEVLPTSSHYTCSKSSQVSEADKHRIENGSYKEDRLLSELLSEREIDVLRLVAAGFSNREIADRLVIAIGTAKKHIENIYNKLDVHRRTQLVAKAQILGLLTVNEQA